MFTYRSIFDVVDVGHDFKNTSNVHVCEFVMNLLTAAQPKLPLIYAEVALGLSSTPQASQITL